MVTRSDGPSLRQQPNLRPLAGDPIVFADLLLRALLRRSNGSLIIEAGPDAHRLGFQRGDELREVAGLDGPFADAVVARLSLIADLPLAGQGLQISRFKARRDEDRADLLLAVRQTPHGLSSELYRLESAGGPFTQSYAANTSTDRYQILELIGSGGMGAVYKARHRALDKLVALKILHPEHAQDAVYSAQFVIEARAASRIEHPGVVDVRDFGQLADGRSFIAMELVEWPRLDSILRAEEVPPLRGVQIVKRLTEVVDTVSRHGVVHRDLKPGNIFIGPNDEVKIGDFGIAWIVDPTRSDDRALGAETVIGTPAYMSPEQVRGESSDVRSDIYSLGCILFFLVSGKYLQELDPDAATAPMRIGDTPLVVDRDGAPLPEPVRRVVERSTAQNVGERYRTPKEMLTDLAAAEQALTLDDWRKWLPR